jgi:hypothetical protein
MVIASIEEKCLKCPAPISGTIQIQTGRSYTAGDFDPDHSVDHQRAGPDRVLVGVSTMGSCSACGASYSYKVFTVMQLRMEEKAAR